MRRKNISKKQITGHTVQWETNKTPSGYKIKSKKDAFFYTLHGAVLHAVEIARNLPAPRSAPSLCGHQGNRFHPSRRKAIQKPNNYIHFIMKVVELNQRISIIQKSLVLKLNNNLGKILKMT